MFTIRGKLLIYALEIIAAVILLLSIPPWDWWVKLGLAALSISALLLALLMGRSIATAVDALVAATRRIGEGRYDERVRVHGSDELAILAGEIERMRALLREKVRLLEELSRELESKVEERTKQLQAVNERLAVIHQVTNTVNSELDFQEIFEAVVSGTRRLVDFDQASVARIVAGTASVLAISGSPSAPSQPRTMPVAGSRLQGVVETGRPALFDRHPLAEAGEDTLLMSAIAREVVLPLRVGDQVIGTFNLGSRRRDAFSATEIDVLLQIAGELGGALLRAEAFERERSAARKLRELSDLKSEFVAKVSHELRTPLTSILGGVDNLIDGIAGPLAPKVEETLGRVHSNGLRLLALINDLLDLGRIEAGEEELRPVRFSLPALLHEVVEMVRPVAQERRITVAARAGGELSVVADRDKIARVLLNLLHNAIKFTDAGGAVEAEWAPGRAGTVDVRIRDTGVGIDAAELSRIFDKFHQVRRSRDAGLPGSGLGLPISRELARLHGGDISVASEVGAGSTFTLTLPVSLAERIREAG